MVIINDDEPEIDERFEVQLVSVTESGQRIDSEQVSLGHHESIKLPYNKHSSNSVIIFVTYSLEWVELHSL